MERRLINDTVSGLPSTTQVDYDRSGIFSASGFVSYTQMYGTGIKDPIKDIKFPNSIYLNFR